MKRNQRTALALAAASLTALGLAACSGSEPASPVGSWQAESPDETVLEFVDDGSYSGSDGCNRVLGSWEAGGDAITISPMATTLMACEGVDVWLVDPASVKIQGDTMVVLDSSGAEMGTLKQN